MTLGSLFDGSGGFPLAGALNGIELKWLAEIEPYPCRVTAARFPGVPNLGDVTKINGAEIVPVDIITFGSPCQDLSVAGKQLGIHAGERSNLFFEAIRIIREMRLHDFTAGRSVHDVRPRFAVWENVPGAFSSNGGKDFQAVLQALCEIPEGSAIHVPEPPKGKWFQSGCVVGAGWSIAWRVYDAQYWGVPQRRKRIYLVADFRSERAGEILFERESLRGNPAAGGETREGTAADAEGSAGGSCLFEPRSLMEENWSEQTVKNALRANASKVGHCVVQDNVKCLNPWDSQSIRQYDVNGVAPNINANSSGGQNRWGVCYPAAFMGGQGAKARSIAYCDDGSTPTLKSSPSGGNTIPDVVYATQGNGVDRDIGQNGGGWREGQMYTLNTVDRPAVCFQQNQRDEVRDMGESSGAQTAQGGTHNQNYVCYDARGNGDGKIAPTCTGDHENRVTDYTAICVGNGQLHQTDLGLVCGALNCMHDQQAVVTDGKPPRKYIVRRLTPLECCRLQGFPDWWEDGVEGSDSARYKMWGNGIALPCAADVLGRIAKEGEK